MRSESPNRHSKATVAQNSHEILLQMPGVQDPEHVKKLIDGESHLELVHVVSPPNPAPVTDLLDRGRGDRVT